MSVVVSEREHHHELICKGAAEELFDICTRVHLDGHEWPLDTARRKRFLGVLRGLNEQGLRVVAVAMKEMQTEQRAYSVEYDTDLSLMGFIVFIDLPKADNS